MKKILSRRSASKPPKKKTYQPPYSSASRATSGYNKKPSPTHYLLLLRHFALNMRALHILLLEWWKPLFYWLLDTCKTNAYLIWKTHRGHTKFFDTLVDELLTIPLESEFPPVNPLRPIHTLEYLEKPTYCAWGLKNRGNCVQEPLNKRKFEDEIVNQSRLTQRPSQVKTGCKECSKALCTRKRCWDKWHAQK